MHQNLSALLVIFTVFSFPAYSQTSRSFAPERRKTAPETESMYLKEIRTIENKEKLSFQDIYKLIDPKLVQPAEAFVSDHDDFFSLRQQLPHMTPPILESHDLQQINDQQWEVNTTYLRKINKPVGLDNDSTYFTLYEIIRVKTLRQDDTLQNFSSTEKIFYWLGQEPSHDFSIVYKEHKVGKLKQEVKQVFAGKDQLSNFLDYSHAGLANLNQEFGYDAAFEIYPNPASISQLSILFNTIKPNSTVAINLFDATGRNIKSFNLSSSPVKGLSRLTLDIGQQPPGIYIVKLSHAGIASVQKLVISH